MWATSAQKAAANLGIPRRSADHYWAFARSWLYAELRQADEAAENSLQNSCGPVAHRHGQRSIER